MGNSSEIDVMKNFALIALTLLVPATASAQKKITYEEHVKPIFRAKCFNCPQH